MNTSSSSLRLVMISLLAMTSATACFGGGEAGGAPESPALEEDEQDLAAAPTLEVVETDDVQGTRIRARGLPAVAESPVPGDSGRTYVHAALLLETWSTAPGYASYALEERDRMGSFTGSTTPVMAVDPRTSPPTVTVLQDRIDRLNAELKNHRWSRFVEHPATNDSVATSSWTVRYDRADADHPRLHVHRGATEVLNKSARYFSESVFGPQGCTYTPELASAAISSKHKALLVRVRYAPSDTGAGCWIVDRYFTEALP